MPHRAVVLSTVPGVTVLRLRRARCQRGTLPPALPSTTVTAVPAAATTSLVVVSACCCPDPCLGPAGVPVGVFIDNSTVRLAVVSRARRRLRRRTPKASRQSTPHSFDQGALVFSVHSISPRSGSSVGGGDRFRVDLRCGVRVDVPVGVSLQPDSRTDPLFPLTPQVSPSVNTGWLCCDRPVLVSGLSPWGGHTYQRGGDGGWMIRFCGCSRS